MKDGIGKLIFVLTIIFILLLFSSPYLFIELWNIQSGRSTIFELTINGIKDDIDSAINKDKYNKILNEYIKKRFGDSLSKKFEIIKNDGWRYVVKFDDIMDETFYIAYYKGKHSCSDNFEQVISNDKKFQHLYSEWVKKQVGIEDENVELKFSEARFWSRSFGKPYIDFSKITNLDNIEEQIYKNTKNIYILSNYYDPGIIITIDNTEDIKTLLNYTDIIEKKIHSMLFINKENSNYKNKKNNVLYIKLIDKSNEDYIDVKYNYDDNSKFYRYKTNNSEWIKYE